MDQKNILFAVVVSVAILLGWQMLFERPQAERERQQQAAQQQAEQAAPQVPGRPSAPGVPTPESASAPPAGLPGVRSGAVEASPRVKIVTPRVTGSLALRGSEIDDLTLTDYRETVDPNSPPITLLSPGNTPSNGLVVSHQESAVLGLSAGFLSDY